MLEDTVAWRGQILIFVVQYITNQSGIFRVSGDWFCNEIITTHSRVLIHIQGKSREGVGVNFVVLSTLNSETHKNVWVPKIAPLPPVH